MMLNFTSKWEEIADLGYQSARFRVDAEHQLDLYISYTTDGHRQFLFQSIYHELESIDLPNLENIRVEVLPVNGVMELSLTLLDGELKDLFSVMCLDLAEASNRAPSPDAAASIFISRLNHWSQLLSMRRAGGMSFRERLGLLGELILLDWLMRKVGLPCGPLLRGWRGPDGDSTDLAVGGTRIEVKAQLSTFAPRLRISSLEQLEIAGGELYVALHRLSRSDKGHSLYLLVDSISKELQGRSRELLEFHRKLILAGYDPDSKANEETFALDKRLVYLVSEGFPSLTPSTVPEGVVAVTYDILCGYLKSFEVELSDFEKSLRG